MNPYSAYSSLKKKKRILQFGLFMLVVAQLIFWGCINLNIPVPSNLLQLIIKTQLPDKFKIDFKETKVSFPDQLAIDELLIFTPSGNRIRFQHLRLKISYFNLFLGLKDALTEFSFKEFEFKNDKKPSLSLKSKEGIVRKVTDQKIFLDLTLHSRIHELNLHGIINLNKLIIPENIISRIKKGGDTAYSFPKFILNEIQNSKPIVLDALLIQNDSLNFSFLQRHDSKNDRCIVTEVQGFTTLDKKLGNYISKTRLICDRISLISGFQKIQINDPEIQIIGYLNNGLNNLSSCSVAFSKTSTTLFGPISGNIPSLFTRFEENNDNTKVFIFSDTNHSQISLSLEMVNGKRHSLCGEANFSPKEFNLYVQKHNKLLRLIDGENLHFYFYKNIDSRSANFPSLFRIVGEELSVLESAKGEFLINGEADNDLNVNLKNCYGKIGSSDVVLSYTQNWKPLQFKFVVDGYCIPTDIINWMPPWWENLWHDFKFTKEIPKGSFTIAGIWGGPAGNSRTNGYVETKTLKFRNLPIKSSNLWVSVDDKITKVTGNEIFHDQGKLNGMLEFPKKNLKSPVFLNFDFEGEFPFNQGKQVFGENVYKYLSDINSSKIECVASGKIIRSESNESDEYQISLRSEKGGIFKGIPFESLHGKIFHKDKRTIGKFDPICLAGGSSKLSYESVEYKDSSILSLNFDLKDANSSRFISIISDLNPKNSNTFIHPKSGNNEQNEDKNGKINLVLQAKGPPSDFLQFEGTGSLKLYEKGLSQINLLGGISRELAKFTILPSGAFTFEELGALFKINHGTMTFDEFRLTGPISSIDGSGDLDLANGKLDLISKINFAGNIPIPGLRQLVNLADPISKIFEVKINGTISEPKWKLVINPLP